MTPSAVHRLRALAVGLSLSVVDWLPTRLRLPPQSPDDPIPEHLWRALSPEENDEERDRARRARRLLLAAIVVAAAILGAIVISRTA